MAAGSLTSRSTPKLSEAARHLILPAGIVSTGWPAVEKRCEQLGVRFDPWQQGLGRAILGKRADGRYAATVGGVTMSIPRQVGKTYLVGWIVFALCLLFPGTTVLWTAHRTRTSTRTFQSLAGMARRTKVKPFIAPNGVRSTNGEQEIRFRNGSVIMFGAREAGFGRGFDAVDIEVFDEAQILTTRALEDMVAATNQSKHPHGALLFYMGTPPRPVDPGEVFTDKRDKALSGKLTDGLYVEFSADSDADPDDLEQVAKANPSFPERTPLEAIQRMRENLPDDDSLLREAFGIWDATGSKSVIPLDAWNAQADPDSLAVGRFALGLEAGPNLAAASVSLAGQRADGGWHVELDEHRSGAHWLAAYVDRLVKANPQIRAVVGDVGGPLAALLEERSGRYYLKGTRVVVMAPTVRELGTACTLMLDGVTAGSVWNLGQPQLAAMVGAAGKRRLGDTGMWVYSRTTAAADITGVQAATLALWGAQHSRARKPMRASAGSGGRRAVVL